MDRECGIKPLESISSLRTSVPEIKSGSFVRGYKSIHIRMHGLCSKPSVDYAYVPT